MKHLNFSFKSRWLLLPLMLFTLSIGQMWGQVASATVTNGGTYVVAAYYNQKYYALPNGTTGGMWAATEVELNNNGQVTTANAPTWTFTVNPNQSDQFYLTYTSGNSTYYLYKNGNTNSNYNIAGKSNGDKNYWKFTRSNNKYNVIAVGRGTYHTRLQLYTSQTKWEVYQTSSTTYDVILLELAPSCQSWQNPTVTYSATTLSAGGDHATISSITGTTYGAVSYTSSNTNILTVDANGEVTPIANGTAKVTVSWAGNSTYCSKDVDVNFTVNKASATISLEDAGAGSTPSGTFYGGDSYSLPITAATCTGKVLVGWSTVEIPDEGAMPTSNYYAKGTSVTLSPGTNTFYAVYANSSSEGEDTYVLISSASDFEDGTYVAAALDGGTYYFVDGTAVSAGIGTESTGLASTSIDEGEFEASSIPSGAVELTIEDDGDPDGSNHYYFISYTDGDDTYYLDDTGAKQSLNWVGSADDSYHPNFSQNSGTNGCVLLSSSGAKVSENSTTRASSIRNYASSGSYYRDIYFFKKESSVSYSNYATSCCSPLGSINGSVSWTNSTTAVLTWKRLSSQVTSWGNVTYGTSGSTACAVDPSDNTLMRCTIPNLTCGTEYTFTLHPTLESGVCEIEEGKDSTIVASYPKPTITLDKEGTSNGDFSISGNLTSQCPGENVTVELAPNSGYEVDALMIGETDYASSVSNNTYTFEMPSTNVTIHATFKTSAKPAVDVTATEGLTDNTLSFGNVEKETDKALTITVTGSNLTNDVTWALTDNDSESASMFSISPSSTTIGQSAATSGQALEITFTPAAAKTYTATLTFSTTGAAADKVITLTGTGVNLYTVTLNAGTGSISDGSWTESEGVWTKKQGSYQEALTLPTPTLSSSLTEAGWSFSGWKTESAVTPQTNVKPSYVTTSYAPTSNITLYAVYEKTSGGTAVDEITRATTGMDDQTGGSVSYTAWSNKQATSDAKYAGTSAANYNSIQISGTTPRGFVSTASGGLAKKVTVTWYSGQTTGDKYAVEVYGKNTAYSGSSDLFSSESATQGAKLGSLAAANTGTSELTISGDYAYIGIRAKDNALYLMEVDIEWSTASKSYYSNPSDKVTLTYDANYATAGSAPAAVSNITIGDKETVAAKPEGLAKTGYDFGGWNTKADGTGTNYTAGTDEITMTDNITLYAKWTKHDYTVAVADVDHTIITATPQGGSAIAEKANAAVAYEKEVTLAKTDDPHFTVAWDVYETGNSSNKVIVSENTFTVPAFDVTVSAIITEDAKRNVKFYSNGAQLGTTQEVYVGEAPVAETAVYEDCLEGSNQFYGWATEEWTGAIDASTLAGKTVETGDLPSVTSGEGDVNYYAVWAAGSPSTTVFKRATSLSELKDGTEVIITTAWKNNSGKNRLLKGDALSTETTLTLPSGNWTITNDQRSSYVWTLGKSNSDYTLTQTNKLGCASMPGAVTKTNTNSTWKIARYSHATNTQYQNCFTIYQENSGDASNDYYLEYNSGWITYNTTPGSESAASANTWVTLYVYIPTMVAGSDFRTNCCALKPATNVTVDGVTASSVTLAWTAPSSTAGINKLQIVNADNGNVLTDNISASATGGTVTTGLTECESINLKVVSVGDDCSSNSNVVAAIPQDDAKTVTFDYNEGTGTPASATTPCGETTVDLPATPTRDGYRFMGWNDGNQTLAVNATTYTPAASVTLTAQWAQLFTITYDLNGGTLAPAPSHAPAIAGESVELASGTPDKGFMATFTGWRVTYIDANEDEQTVTVSAGAFTMPAANVTITAQYDEIVGQWILVDDASELAEDDYVVIAAASAEKAMSTTQNNNNRGITDITKSGSTISAPSESVEVFQLKEGNTDGTWAFKVRTATNYIYAASTGSNYLRTRNYIGEDGAADWTIVTEDGNTTVTANLENGHNLLQYNSTLFSAYGSAQTNGDIALYVFREGTFYNVNMPAVAPVGGALSTNKSMAKAGETVTLTFKPGRGYKVKTLTVTGATSGSIDISPDLEDGVTAYTFTMPAEAVTVAASFEAVPPVDYNLVTDAANLAIGVQFLIVGNETNGYRAAATRNGEYLYAISIEDPETNKVSITTEDVVDFVLSDKDGDNWVISSIEGKLSATTGGNISYNGDNDKWGISISEGDATITNGSYKLRYNYNNGTTPRFKTYSNNTGEIPALYALPYTTYNFVLDGCKTIKVVTGYMYTYTIKNSDEPTSKPGDNYTFVNKWTDGTNTYAVGDEVTVSATKILQPCWKVTTPEEEDVTDIDGLPESVTEIVVSNDKNLNVNDDRTINTLTIKSTSGAMDVAGTSGQVTGDNTLTVTDNLFLEIKLRDGDMDAAASRMWYCISAPFDVDINNGFYWGDGTHMGHNVDFQIFEWDGDRRATGASGWRRTSGTMKKDTAYFIGFDDARSNQNTIKLKATDNTISNRAKIVAPAHSGSAEAATYGNWNGLANPNFHHIALNKDVQAFDYNKQGYSPYETGEYNFVVGTPFFIQYAGDIAIEAADNAYFRAPRRGGENYSYSVRIGSADARRADNRIIVRASETASAEFDNERDMITLNGTSSNYGALLWTENYGGKRLAIEEAPLVNGTASYVLTLSAPANGTYSISVAAAQENADLYLTYEGAIIWNLSMGAYTMDLNKGITNGYGLLLQAKAPNAATGVDEVTGDGLQVTGAQKVIIDEHVYILRGGQMYDVNGKMVK